MSEGDLPLRAEVEEARRVVDAAGTPPDSAACWRLGELLVQLLEGFDPRDTGPKKKAREMQLSQLSPLIGLTTARMRDYWRFAFLFPPELRVEGKSWNEHRMAAIRSSEGRNNYDILVALRLLAGEDGAQELADPFVDAGLTSQQLERARRIWRHRDDFNDRTVVKAVAEELRGQRKKGVNTVASAAHAVAQRKLRDAEKLAQAMSGDNALTIVNAYHTQMLKATDASYQLKMIMESLPAGELRLAVKAMIEGSIIAASRAIEDLLDVLEETAQDCGPHGTSLWQAG